MLSAAIGIQRIRPVERYRAAFGNRIGAARVGDRTLVDRDRSIEIGR